MLSSAAIFWARVSSWPFTESGMSAESAGKVMRIWPSVAAAGGTEAVCVAAVPLAVAPVSVPVAAGTGGALGTVDAVAGGVAVEAPPEVVAVPLVSVVAMGTAAGVGVGAGGGVPVALEEAVPEEAIEPVLAGAVLIDAVLAGA